MKKLFFSRDIQINKKDWSKLFELICFDSLKDLPEKEDFGLLIHSGFTINEETIGKKNISFIASFTSGVDHIDQEYLKRIKIPFFYAAGHNAIPVAEYVIESLCLYFSNKKINIKETKVVIVGGGNIGSAVNTLLNKLDIKDTTIIDPYLYPKMIPKKKFLLKDFSPYVEKADLITFHTPLTHDGIYPTYKLLGKALLSQCKNNPLIINTSRGKIAEEEDLLSALQKGTISQLITDVWENEQIPTENTKALAKLVFIGTPHLAGKSILSLRRGEEKLRKQIFHLYEVYTIGSIDMNYQHVVPPKIDLEKIEKKGLFLKEITEKFRELFTKPQCHKTKFREEFKKLRTEYGTLRKEWSEINW